MSQIGDQQFVDFVWCPVCQLQQGEIWEEITRVDNGIHYKHCVDPDPLPTYCSVCNGLLERDLGARSRPKQRPTGSFTNRVTFLSKTKGTGVFNALKG